MSKRVQPHSFEKHGESQPESLSKRVVRGGIWVFALRIANRGLGFIRIIILARLLAPKDFGLLGIASLAIATLATFSQIGFQTALIQKREDIKSYLDTAWTVSAIRGAVLFLVLFFSAPIIAAFFDSPQASLVIRVIAVSPLLTGISNIGILFFQKELEFRRQFIYEISGTLVDLTVAISLAFILRNVWALVWGGLAAKIMRFFMSYILHPYRPSLKFEKEKFEKLFGFGKWVLGSSILVFLVTQGDDIFVGKMLGVTALGFYRIAYLISNLPTTEIAHVISQTTFPAYSKLQQDRTRVGEAYIKVLQLTLFISAPLAGGIFVLAPEFTQIFLGDKWMQMVPAIQVLVLAGLIRAIIATTGPVFNGMGRPHIETICQVVWLVVLAGLIYPFTVRWGLVGTSTAVLLSVFVAANGFSFWAIRITKCGVGKFGKMIGIPLLNTAIMVSVISALKLSVQLTPIVHFILLVGLGVISYIAVTFLSDKLLDYGIGKLIKDHLALR